MKNVISDLIDQSNIKTDDASHLIKDQHFLYCICLILVLLYMQSLKICYGLETINKQANSYWLRLL